jgi:hypothetical protein
MGFYTSFFKPEKRRHKGNFDGHNTFTFQECYQKILQEFREAEVLVFSQPPPHLFTLTALILLIPLWARFS